MKAKILIVDDEQDTLELVGFNFQNAGYRVLTARNGKEALEKARRSPPDLIVLDLILPGMDGLELCKIFRREPATAAVPIIMLSARDSELDRVLGFELGANDYVTKPFSPRELVLRVAKQLQHLGDSDNPEEVLRFGEVVLDLARHVMTVRGEPVELTATEFKLLTVLAQRKGRVQSRERLLRDVWGYDQDTDSRTVDTHIRRVREKLGRASKYVATVRGFGYQLLNG